MKEEIKYDIEKIRKNITLFIEREGTPILFHEKAREELVSVPTNTYVNGLFGRESIYRLEKRLVTPKNYNLKKTDFRVFLNLSYKHNNLALKLSVAELIKEKNHLFGRLLSYIEMRKKSSFFMSSSNKILRSFVEFMQVQPEPDSYSEFNITNQPSLENCLAFQHYFTFDKGRIRISNELSFDIPFPQEIRDELERIPEELRKLEYDFIGNEVIVT